MWAAFTASKVFGVGKKVFTSKWLYVALVFVAIAGGTFFYLKQDKKEAVAQATKTGDMKASNTALKTESVVADRQEQRDRPFIILREQTVKDYTNARATLQAAPAADRDAVAPRVIIDTLNNLDRMRAVRDAGTEAPVPDAEVPVG